MSNKELKFDFSDIEETENDKLENEKLEEMTSGLPDPGTSRLERFKKRPRVALNFSVPDTLKKSFEEKAIELGYTRKYRGAEFADLTGMLYHCMRSAGVDIPDFKYIDGRKK